MSINTKVNVYISPKNMIKRLSLKALKQRELLLNLRTSHMFREDFNHSNFFFGLYLAIVRLLLFRLYFDLQKSCFYGFYLNIVE